MDEPSSPEGNPITLRIKFKSASLDEFVARYGADVSAGGIFIRTKQPLAVGSLLHFDFSLADGSPLMAGIGTVVWIREPDQSRVGSIPGMGVRFDQLAPESQQTHQQILATKARLGDHTAGAPFSGSVAAPAARSPARPATPPPIGARPAPVTPVAAQPSGRGSSDTFDEFGSGGKTEIADKPPSFYFDALDSAHGAAAGARQAEEAAPSAALENTETDSQPTVGTDSLVSEPIDISEDAGGAARSAGAAAAQAATADLGRFQISGDELAPETLDLPLGGHAGSGRCTDLPPLSGLDAAAGAPSADLAAGQGWLDQPIDMGDGAGAAPIETPAEHTEETAAPPEAVLAEAAAPAVGEGDRLALQEAEDLGQDVPAPPVKKLGGQGKTLIVVGIVAAALAFAGVYLLQVKPWQTRAVPVARPTPAMPAPAPVAPPAVPKVAVPAQPTVQPTPTVAKVEPVKPAENVPAPTPKEEPAQTKPEAIEIAKPEATDEGAKRSGPAKKAGSKLAASSPPGAPAPAGAGEIVYMIRVRSLPPGAEILIDGEPMGQTPFQRRILDIDKPHMVTIRKPGYLLYESSVSLSSGHWVKDGSTETTNVFAKLKRAKGQSAPTPPTPGDQPEPVTDQPDKL
jgi:uncharacterized protein (TIGR02266 family)